MAEKHSVQVNENNVVMGICTDSLGRIPEGNIPLINTIDFEDVLDAKYDPNAETEEEKTATSFTKPSAGKYWDENGVEQDLPTE